MAGFLLLLFLAIVIIGVPIGFGMGFLTISSFLMIGGSMLIIPQKLFSGIDNFTFLCIPLFILAGEIMSSGNLMEPIVHFCDCLVGHIRGGLALVNVLASKLFAGISGSATADAVGLGRIEIDMMCKGGYKRSYACAVTAASAIIGPIIPPSGIMIIYAVCAGNVSVSKMFLGGLIPGILLGLFEMAACYYLAVRYHHPKRERRATGKELRHAVKTTAPVLLLPLIILGGIATGVFTATESGAVAVFYALFVSVFVMKSLTMKELMGCLKRTAKTTANVMFIIAVASAMGWAITTLRIPQQIIDFCLTYIGNKYTFLLFVNVLLLFIGMILDQSPALLIMVPILLPVALRYGIDPLHFGMVVCVNLTVGLITPPVGMTLFVTANVGKVKLTELYREILPFIACGIAAVLLVTYVPAVTTWLPNLLFQ